MEHMAEDLGVDTNVMIFRVKLFLARTELNEAMSRTQFQTATEPPVKDAKLDVTDLPTRVLKHLITSGIVRGKIFELSDAFACLSCNPELQAKFPGKRNAFIYIKGPHHQSLLLAVDTVEMLLDEVVKRNTGPVSKVPALERYWSEMREVDYEIKDFPVAAIKNVIFQGHYTREGQRVLRCRGKCQRKPSSVKPSPERQNSVLAHPGLLIIIQFYMLTNNSGSQATMVKQPVSNSSTLTETSCCVHCLTI
ncbi:uncharacterized protein LOC124372950 [Homalodisca vitripennis]|uniref:uncharacterized protein LOC124372950 n=1 Tax=Homalodisca vitripennis TaxID=197043 RepID=UPI001EEA7711|nr:uncharacterized protein LOC124372950 [Homalodisca vitripennis]